MTLCLNPRPTIPSGLLSDPYFQREVLSREALTFHSEVAAVIATAAEFVKQLADALKNFGMAMLGAFKEAMDAVADAVEKVVNVIASFVDWVMDTVVHIVTETISDLMDNVKQELQEIGAGLMTAVEKGQEALSSYFITTVLPIIMGIGVVVFALTLVVGYLIQSMPLIGAVVTAVIAATLTAVILGTLMSSNYYAQGQNMDTSESGIKNWLHSVNPALALAFANVADLIGGIFVATLLEESDSAFVKLTGLWFLSIFASITFLVVPPTPASGTAMIPFLALAFATLGDIALEALKILKSLFEEPMQWGRSVITGCLFVILAVSSYLTIKTEMAYVSEAFTGGV